MRQFLENMTGLSIYPMISLVLFVVAFGLALLRALTLSKKMVENLKNLPLEADDQSSFSKNQA